MSRSHSESISSAAVLEPAGITTLDVGRAMACVAESLSKTRAHAGQVYGVFVFGQPDPHPKLNSLTAASTFFKAYLRGWGALSHVTNFVVSSPDDDHLHAFETSEFRNVRIFIGDDASESDWEEKLKGQPGVYILTSHLDSSLLEELGLPLLPQRFRNLPLVMQVEDVAESDERSVAITQARIGSDQASKAFDEDKVEEAVSRDTLAWRQRFMEATACWTSSQVAAESASTAKNRAAIASRWLQEKKIFAIKFQGQQYFPRFQFQDGNPMPIVAEIIRQFPEHATGWDFAYFFTTGDPNLGGRKPLELLKSDPARARSLAKAFAHPADVF